MRTKIELLELLKREIIEANHFSGMCVTVSYMSVLNKASIKERLVLRSLIKEMKPKPILKHCEIKFLNSGYYWREGLKEPRIKAIDKKIKELRDAN